MIDKFAGFMMIAGSLFIFIAALGVLRMPELYVRIHSSTKAGTLGLGLILLSVAMHFQDFGITIRAAVTTIFIVLTAPVAAHVIGRAAYRTGVPLWHGTIIDELKSDENPERSK